MYSGYILAVNLILNLVSELQSVQRKSAQSHRKDESKENVEFNVTEIDFKS